MKNILVIDGNSIINRAFYGIRPLSTKSGQPTNAIFGMLNIVMKHFYALKPQYAAVAFDLHTPTFRKKMYDAYKAGRHETPPDLLAQFDKAKECLGALGFHVLTLEGYEADDILGTVAEFANKEPNTHAYILSGDRDLLQLIDENVTVLLASSNDTIVFDENKFKEKYHISPDQFVDLKALMGDSSDNIPGVMGVGEKTAIKLISEFKSLDGIYENINSDSISAGLRTKLENDRKNAYLSQKLAEIVRNAPLGKTKEELEYKGIDEDKLYNVLNELEFYAMIKKLGLKPPTSISTSNTVVIPEENYTEADAYVINSEITGSFAVYFDDDSISISTDKKNFIYKGSLKDISPLFERDCCITTFDSKKLYHFLANSGIHVHTVLRDTMLSAYVLDSQNAQKSLSQLASIYLHTDAEGMPKSHLLLPLDSVLRKLLSDNNALELLDEIELPLSLVLFDMEKEGFKVNIDGLDEFGEKIRKKAEDTENEIYSLAGEKFNVNSTKQLGEILFEKLSLPHGKKTKNGYSTGADILESLKNEHPIIGLILEYRQLTKLYSTYVVGLEKACDANGRIHTDFKQALTATGRLSSAEPNLQNIPIRTSMGREMRRFFTAENGNVLVDADYSQIELRLLAAISGDENMIDAFRSGADIHTRTASAVFNIPETFVDEDLRKRAKAVNFGIVYGIGAFSLASDIGTSVSEAKQYIESYFKNYPKIDSFLKETVEKATKNGYTETAFGRRRYIPELKSTNTIVRNLGKRIAMNSPIQGTAADVIKIAMIRTSKRLKRELPSAKLIMQVHDELIIECPEPCAEKAKEILKESMEGAADFAVALTVDVSIGKTWLK